MTIGEDNVRLALQIPEGITAIKSIQGLTTDTVDKFIPGITTGTKDISIPGIITGTKDICIPGLAVDIRDVCTPSLTMGITGTGKIGKLFCYQIVKRGKTE